MMSASALFTGLIFLVIAGLICWLLWWFISYIGLPEPFNKIARVLVALVAVVLLINFLLGLVGTPFIRW